MTEEEVAQHQANILAGVRLHQEATRLCTGKPAISVMLAATGLLYEIRMEGVVVSDEEYCKNILDLMRFWKGLVLELKGDVTNRQDNH